MPEYAESREFHDPAVSRRNEIRYRLYKYISNMDALQVANLIDASPERPNVFAERNRSTSELIIQTHLSMDNYYRKKEKYFPLTGFP